MQRDWRAGAPLIPIREIAAASYWCLGGVRDRIPDRNNRNPWHYCTSSPYHSPISRAGVRLRSLGSLKSQEGLKEMTRWHLCNHKRRSKTTCRVRPRHARKRTGLNNRRLLVPLPQTKRLLLLTTHRRGAFAGNLCLCKNHCGNRCSARTRKAASKLDESGSAKPQPSDWKAAVPQIGECTPVRKRPFKRECGSR